MGPMTIGLAGKSSVGCAIHGDYDNFLGIMSIDVELDLLARICRDIRLGKSGYVTLVDQNGQIIFHPPARVDRKIRRPPSGQSGGGILAERLLYPWQPGDYGGKLLPLANWSIIGISDRAELIAEMTTVARMSFCLNCWFHYRRGSWWRFCCPGF